MRHRSTALGIARFVALAALAALWTAGAQADVLELRNGQHLEGRLLEAGPDQLRFESAAGVQLVPVSEAAGVRFGTRASEATVRPPTPAAAKKSAAPRVAAVTPPAPALPSGPRVVQVPAGSLLQVRMNDSIDPRQVAEGDRFAAFLDAPISVQGVGVVPAHTPVYGVVSSAKTTGPLNQRLQVELVELQVQGKTFPIVTGNQEPVDTALGIEGHPGPASAAASGDRIPAGSVLQFRLLQALEIVVQTR